MPLGIAIKPEACLVDGAGLADAGQRPASGGATDHGRARRCREERNARGFGEGGKTMKPFRIVAMKTIGHGDIDTAFEMRG